MKKPLIVVGSAFHSAEAPEALAPCKEYVELSKHMDGTLLTGAASTGAGGKWLQRRVKLNVGTALRAALRASRYQAVVATSENTAIPLALLLPLFARRTPLVAIAHKLSSGSKRQLFRLGLHRRFAAVICVSQPQATFAVDTLQLPETRVHFILDKVDHRFFSPQSVAEEDFVLAVGQEQRDYATLLRAMARADLRLVVVASSPWSTNSGGPEPTPKTTVLRHLPYTQLRELYAKARVVVVPLHDADYAAGANGVLEGLAMGKCVIATRTRGLTGYIDDGETGLLVPPADPIALADAILRAWDDEPGRRRLGTNARGVVERRMNMDTYVSSVSEIVRAVAHL